MRTAIPLPDNDATTQAINRAIAGQPAEQAFTDSAAVAMFLDPQLPVISCGGLTSNLPPGSDSG
jgi:hypothetical protein